MCMIWAQKTKGSHTTKKYGDCSKEVYILYSISSLGASSLHFSKPYLPHITAVKTAMFHFHSCLVCVARYGEGSWEGHFSPLWMVPHITEKYGRNDLVYAMPSYMNIMLKKIRTQEPFIRSRMSLEKFTQACIFLPSSVDQGKNNTSCSPCHWLTFIRLHLTLCLLIIQ